MAHWAPGRICGLSLTFYSFLDTQLSRIYLYSRVVNLAKYDNKAGEQKRQRDKAYQFHGAIRTPSTTAQFATGGLSSKNKLALMIL